MAARVPAVPEKTLGPALIAKPPKPTDERLLGPHDPATVRARIPLHPELAARAPA